MTTMTKNGVSTTLLPGQEKHERFQLPVRGRKLEWFVQYDYRHTNGGLFSCVKHTLKECREARDRALKAGNIFPSKPIENFKTPEFEFDTDTCPQCGVSLVNGESHYLTCRYSEI
jgi:hypothetical protein